MKPLLIAVEGLGIGAWLGANYLQEEILPNLDFNYDIDIQVLTWLEPKPVFPTTRKLVFVTHSFGAAWACGQQSLVADTVITIDPRWTGFDTFNKAPGVKTWLNFYQRNLLWFPGCSVAGAVNDQITDMTNHVNMPARIFDLVDWKNILTP